MLGWKGRTEGVKDGDQSQILRGDGIESTRMVALG